MLKIRLKDEPRTVRVIPRYRRLLQEKGLAIIGQEVDTKNGTIDLVINARLFEQVQCAINIAQGFFLQSIIDISTQTPILSQDQWFLKSKIV